MITLTPFECWSLAAIFTILVFGFLWAINEVLDGKRENEALRDDLRRAGAYVQKEREAGQLELIT